MTGDVSPPRASRWDQRLYVELPIYWSPQNIQRVMALVDTGAETSIIYGDPNKFHGNRVMIGGFGGQTIPVTQTWLKLGVGRLPPREYKVSIAPVQKYILGIDILCGLALQTTVGEFRLRQRCIRIRAVQVILRGHAKHGPICLPKPRRVTNVRQSRLPGGQDEISKTVQEFEKVGIIRPALTTAHTIPTYGQCESWMAHGE